MAGFIKREKKDITAEKAGFTLLELALAAAILAASLVIILAVFIGCSYFNEDLRYRTIAINDARLVIEEIKNASYPSLQNATNPPLAFASWGAWAVAPLTSGGGGLNNVDRPLYGLEGESVTVSYPNGPLADPLEVLVAVSYRGRRQKINPASAPISVDLRTTMTDE